MCKLQHIPTRRPASHLLSRMSVTVKVKIHTVSPGHSYLMTHPTVSITTTSTHTGSGLNGLCSKLPALLYASNSCECSQYAPLYTILCSHYARYAIRKCDLKHTVPNNRAQVHVRTSCSEVEFATLAKGTTALLYHLLAF